MQSSNSSIVLFLNDWPVRPQGAHSGGGEVATLALARAFERLGRKVYVLGNLPDGDCEVDGITFWDFGKEYGIKRVVRRLKAVGRYHCFAATLVHPFLFLVDDPNCLSRIVINHSPSIVSSGLEPATVMQLADFMVCVSEAQRAILLSRGGVAPDRIRVVRNGFDPDIFTYQGPEGRNWRRMIYTGRLEPAKGIHHLIESYSALVQEFPDLELRIFGDENYWPDLADKRRELEARWPGLKFYGKVPQLRLAEELRSAGLLVFPSISFESAGLAVIDAQASGCPVVGSKIGGVPEYLVHDKCGLLVPTLSVQSLCSTLQQLLRNQPLLVEMSRNCLEHGRGHPWSKAASELIALAESVQSDQAEVVIEVPAGPLQRTSTVQSQAYETLLEDHDAIARGTAVSDGDLELILTRFPDNAAPYLWKGLRSEFVGNKDQAKAYFLKSKDLRSPTDWQAMFRLALVYAEESRLGDAAILAGDILREHPKFPLRPSLERLLQLASESR